MPDASFLSKQEREQLELQLLETLRQRRSDWVKASDENRTTARKIYMEALRDFNDLILRGKPPKSRP